MDTNNEKCLTELLCKRALVSPIERRCSISSKAEMESRWKGNATYKKKKHQHAFRFGS